MKLKNGVFTQVTVIRGGKEVEVTPCPEIKYAWQVAEDVSRELTGIEGVITSILDGKHKNGSKHYDGKAFDWRTNHYTEAQTLQVYEELKQRLGSEYDVVLHKGSHMHIEYDPK